MANTSPRATPSSSASQTASIGGHLATSVCLRTPPHLPPLGAFPPRRPTFAGPEAPSGERIMQFVDPSLLPRLASPFLSRPCPVPSPSLGFRLSLSPSHLLDSSSRHPAPHYPSLPPLLCTHPSSFPPRLPSIPTCLSPALPSIGPCPPPVSASLLDPPLSPRLAPPSSFVSH
ncbi:hypothetical protein K438DRAFT_757261 [Mycena galopus ATCC 62051]|nr:hypothetical protein K438DRAFT_757261 [Mycena galopus ATCC 62051]